MKTQDKSLLTKLVITVMVKLVVLTSLWWVFFHDQRVAVDAKRVSDQMLSPGDITSKKGEQP
ncbi:cytochrome oxidase putative small subunit CydP [Rhodoferax sp. BLA1]|uniref:cytochrome oxidase putative small subunit CydP n=1 Tax=Rhodoferax sp. BLA1 TaxID=2576062 RepID=UPI0015D123E4|nr:cytochrome oxidase putative small subunit CydP [Rhodoferax sp. BLA1]